MAKIILLDFKQNQNTALWKLRICSVCLTDALDSKFSDESDELAEEGITGPERTYRGPHITFPLQKKDIDTLIEFFRKKKVYYMPTNHQFTN